MYYGCLRIYILRIYLFMHIKYKQYLKYSIRNIKYLIFKQLYSNFMLPVKFVKI